MSLETIGAGFFGLVVGWITYRTLRRKEGAAALSDIATVVGAVGGAAVTGVFGTGATFGAYCIGLAIGFFAYLIVAVIMSSKEEVVKWMDIKPRKPEE